MATNAPGWELGETREPPMCNKVPAKAHSQIRKGDFVQIHGGLDGSVLVKPQVGVNVPLGVSLYDAAPGESTTVLTYGLVVVKTGLLLPGTVGSGAQVRTKNNLLVNETEGSASAVVGTVFGNGAGPSTNVLILLHIGGPLS